VLDVRKGTWKGFSERAVPGLHKGPSRIALHQDAVVLWRRNVEVADLLADGWHQAPGDRVLFDLTTLTSSLLPPPPLDLRREHFGLAINERWIVYWGGSAKNAHNNPEKLFGDGAVFDLRTRKWTVLPPGPPARSVSTFQLLGDTLLLAGGMDDLLDYAQSDRPHEERTANFQDAWTLDLTRGQWTQLDLPPRTTRLPVCRSCGVEAALSSAYFFGDGWLFDATTRQVHGVAPELGRNAAPQHVEALVLDSRRLLLWTEDEPTAPTGYVFDREKRRWCAVDLAPVAPVMFGARPSISAHQGQLYLWAAESSEQRETTDCPPGAPCARTFETHVTPGGAMIVSFEKVWP
jgi:hypothetical protein